VSEIPVRNIYFLLAYAWDRLEESGVATVSDEDFRNVADLFAKVLAGGVRRLLRRGIDRGYQEVCDTVPAIRGKLGFTESLRSNAFSHGRAFCCFAELTGDTLHNRILAETMRRLLRAEGLDRGLAGELRDCLKRMGLLTPLKLSSSVFGRVQLHGNNAFYAFLLDVCRLVYDSLAVDEATGRHRFRDFLREDGPMARLFEKFVFNFLRREQQEFQVTARKIDWADTDGSPESLEMLPGMRTDVFLTSPARRIVIDTKYYRAPLQSSFGRDTVRSGHLYQLYAYLRNLNLCEPGPAPIEGVLLYPLVDQRLSLDYSIQGHHIRVRMIDLAADWQELSRAALDIVR
jgi:5-methylcytosine-specific restriction enzyme subunit McrC